MKLPSIKYPSRSHVLVAGIVLSSVILQSCIMPKDSASDPKLKIDTVVNKATWRSLIDTDNLTDWQKIGGNASYRLENDTIIGTSIATNKSTYFTTGEIFTDFILEVDIQAQTPLNSGVQFRSGKIMGKKGETVAGYQIELDTAKRAWSGGIYDQGRRGWLYPLSRNQACRESFKQEDWNKYRVEAFGSEIRTFVNGVPCSYIIDDMSPKGFIALQIHSAGTDKKDKTVKWRAPKVLTENVQAHLTDVSKLEAFNYLNNQISASQKSMGWQQLWDGKSLDSLAHTGNWKVQNDILTATANASTNTLSLPVKSHYFELELDVKSSNKADSGIHYLVNKNGKGYEFQLSSQTSVKQILNNTQAMGAVYGITAATNLTEPKGWRTLRINRDWNRVRLVVKGKYVEHWINNIKMVEQQFSLPMPTAVMPIKIENTSGTVAIKNIMIRHLAAPEPVKAFTKVNPGDKEGHVMKKVVPEALIPESPILDLKDALDSFHVHPDFAIDVIADSPLVYDPVYAIYDAAGRVWVLEMTTYMQDTLATGEMEHDSQIVMLTDTDQDGSMDTRQVILANLVLPRALAFVEKGILWADHQSLHFTELAEENGKVKVVKTEMVDKDYAKGGNVEHKPNGMLYSLDNWYYNAKSSKRYRPYPLDVTLPKGSKEIYRNAHWKMALAGTEFRGQWGISQDDYGRHYFVANSSPLKTTSFLPNVAFRNPKQTFPSEMLGQYIGDSDVYPVRVTPGLNRGYGKGMYTEDFKLKRNTAAGGPVIYRGNQYPPKYSNISIVTEPAGNLLRANKIIEEDGKVTGQNLFEQQEILASTDERFRPVNTNNTPDGTIMVVDFYHGILQHRTYLTSYLSEQIKSRDLERNKHIGRLYRLKHKATAMPKVDYLHNLSATQLVPFLAHKNGWHRDMAQQLLVMKQDKSVVDELTHIATSSNNHLAQIKALWVLEGLAELSLPTLKLASQSQHDKVKRSVYRLAELLPASTDLNAWLNEQSQNTTAEAAQALVLAAGTHNAWPAVANIIQQHGNSPFVIASLAFKENAFLAAQQANIPTPVADELLAVSKVVKKPKQQLSGAIAQSFIKGRNLYNGEAGCFGCHGADGEGNPMIPPLNKSEWVTGNPQKLSAILLHGFSGEIKVRDKVYNSGMVMPGLGNNPHFKDQNIADISTYIRNAWDNKASPVTQDMVQSVRHHTQSQKIPYTTESIKHIKGH